MRKYAGRFEVDTPNLAFVLRRPGELRIEVEPDSRWALSAHLFTSAQTKGR